MNSNILWHSIKSLCLTKEGSRRHLPTVVFFYLFVVVRRHRVSIFDFAVFLFFLFFFSLQRLSNHLAPTSVLARKISWRIEYAGAHFWMADLLSVLGWECRGRRGSPVLTVLYVCCTKPFWLSFWSLFLWIVLAAALLKRFWQLWLYVLY